jgi:chorismate-pyruvate lyase
MRRWFACLLLIASPAAAEGPYDLVHLRGDLATGESATQVLTRWCGELKLADPPVVKAVRADADKPATAKIRRLLQAKTGETIRYRKVALTCGGHVLSEADNWYRPGQLTAAMNHALETSDTSFGTVVRPLNFHRQTLAVTDHPSAGTVLEVKALLSSGAGRPFSLVVEDYKADIVAAPPR